MVLDMFAVDLFGEAWSFVSLPAMIGALLVILAWFSREPAKCAQGDIEALTPASAAVPGLPLVEALADTDPVKPKMLGVFVPADGRVLEANHEAGYRFENEVACGIVLPMHRPTHDRALDKSGQWRYGAHFQGRKRLWEVRLQLQFKHDVTEPMRFGVELEDYVPLNSATKRLMGVTVAALRAAAGRDLYHSVGDDPRRANGREVEKPVFAMPMWAFDQLIVTEVGEAPPSLSDPNFHKFGLVRAEDRAKFVEEMSGLKFQAGPTYTFSFWGISQFLDNINWRIQKVVPFTSIDSNMFCGTPPVHLVLYTLKQEAEETRHLESRKQYYFRLAFWSSLKPPSPAKLQRLISKDGGADGAAPLWNSKSKGLARHISGLFACCASQRQ